MRPDRHRHGSFGYIANESQHAQNISGGSPDVGGPDVAASRLSQIDIGKQRCQYQPEGHRPEQVGENWEQRQSKCAHSKRIL
jgi:hypothetical protein